MAARPLQRPRARLLFGCGGRSLEGENLNTPHAVSIAQHTAHDTNLRSSNRRRASQRAGGRARRAFSMQQRSGRVLDRNYVASGSARVEVYALGATKRPFVMCGTQSLGALSNKARRLLPTHVHTPKHKVERLEEFKGAQPT